MSDREGLRRRIRRIQRTLGIRDDGMVGPATVSRLEEEFGIQPPTRDHSLRLSQLGIDELVKFEVSSEQRYTRSLARPNWPGGESGVTIGIGYDLGTQSKAQIRRDWQASVDDATLADLQSASGVRGEAAKRLTTRLRSRNIRIPFDVAKEVFLRSSLPRYAKLTRETYPGIHRLPPDAQSMLLSLVYNRGASLSGSRRREMKAIRAHVRIGDLAEIAAELRAMKRLWAGRGLPGLLKRRDREALLVERSDREYASNEIVLV